MTGKNLQSTSDARVWEAGWEGHELAQMKRLATLTLEQKIRWLKSAHQMAHHMQRPQTKKSCDASK